MFGKTRLASRLYFIISAVSVCCVIDEQRLSKESSAISLLCFFRNCFSLEFSISACYIAMFLDQRAGK